MKWMATLIGILFVAGEAHAQSFFEGKSITLITSTGPGGTYDVGARALARFMPKYIPGKPAMVVQNMPGGGNMLATNYMYSIAPKDGTAIAVVNNAIPFQQAVKGPGVRYDATRFNWLGSTGAKNSAIFVWSSNPAKSITDVLSQEVTIGGTGAGSSLVIYPTAMNNVLGTKFKVVIGYKSSEDIALAMQQGEVEARVLAYSSLMATHPEWIKENKVRFLVQVGIKRDKDLPDVPLMTELTNTEEDREVLKLISLPVPLGQAYLAPPRTPDERVATLRKAFAEAMADKDFRAEAERLQLDLDPMTAEEVAAVVNDTISMPPDIVAKAKLAMGPMADAQ
jgi:tripartite-type tricarboxylate transporter receptor subunit TctC